MRPSKSFSKNLAVHRAQASPPDAMWVFQKRAASRARTSAPPELARTS